MPSTRTIDRRHRIESIMENMHAMKQGFIMRRLRHKILITPSQWAVLAIVMRREEIGVKELAKTLGITSSATTQLIDELVSKKYLMRVANTQDRRALLLRLTPARRKKLNEMKAKRLEHLIRVFSALNDKELREYATLNEKIAKHIAIK